MEKEKIMRILGEIDNIELWEGDAYQGWASSHGQDEIGMAVQNIKLMCLSEMYGAGTTACPHCGAEVEGDSVVLRCGECGNRMYHCNMCDGWANQTAHKKAGERYVCPNDCDIDSCCSFRVDHNQVIKEFEKKEKEMITREQFMDFFRSDHLHEVLTTEDCREIFMTIMKGASDFDDAEELFNEILRDYETGKKAFVVSEDKTIDVWRAILIDVEKDEIIDETFINEKSFSVAEEVFRESIEDWDNDHTYNINLIYMGTERK